MRLRPVLALTTAAAAALPAALAAPPGAAAAPTARSAPPELSETTRLADRRSVVVGDRAYAVTTADGLNPAMGFHTRGEMGGIWMPPIKALDGLWFGVDGRWLGGDVAATRTTSGWGYTRTAYARAGGVAVDRVDTVPDGLPATLVGLTLRSTRDRTVTLTMDAHSELMSAYPWGETQPSQLTYNLQDTGAYDGRSLVFRERGTPPVEGAERHDYAAVVGSSVPPRSARLGPGMRGPQDPPVICPASGPDAPPLPERCDDTEYGKGTGGRLTYRVPVRAGKPVDVWFAVGASDDGLRAARRAQRAALADPAGLLAAKVARRVALGSNTVVDLPGDRLLQRSVEWSKQNLLDSAQESRDLRLRVVNAGTRFPEPEGTLAKARWLGAGWPDYPWLFGTDGEYTAFASVAMGQFADIQAHLRALRDVSEVVNDRSGKVVHEVTPDGSVFFGANEDPGNTDETSKFPSAVALVWRWTGDDAFRDDLYDFSVRGMRYVVEQLDADGDGWPEGLGNVEREGMGEEKLDNTVYTIHGLRDLADMARSKGDSATVRWAERHATGMERRFEQAWWYGGDTRQYADSLAEPDEEQVFQRHWIGVTPMDALLVRPGQVTRPLATDAHGRAALAEREQRCYSDEFGLFHTGTGRNSVDGDDDAPLCDSAVSSVTNEENIYSLNTAIMAVAEGNFGRLGRGQQQRYTTANARIQLDPQVWEQPGAMPEIAPSPDFGANIDKHLAERAMVLQAWGAYGVLWPVVAQQLGVSPDIGRGRLAVVPQLPAGQDRVSGRSIRVGTGSVDVTAERRGRHLRTTVARDVAARLTVGAVLPDGARVAQVTLDGREVAYDVVRSARGAEVRVDAGRGSGTSRLVVRLR